MRNNNREIIRELGEANYRRNRKRNLILISAVALAVIMVFGVFSIARGKIDADYLLYARNGGTVASMYLENGTKEQLEQIRKLSYIQSAGVRNDFAVWQKGEEVIGGCTVLDETAFEEMQRPAYTDITGHYPVERNEVMLPLRALEQLGVEEAEVGMELKADLHLYDSSGQWEETFVLSGYYRDYVDPVMNRPIAYFSEAYLAYLGIEPFPASCLVMEQNDTLDGEAAELKLYEDIPTTDVAQQFVGANPLVYQSVEDFAGGYFIAALCSVIVLTGAFLLIYNILYIMLGNDIRQFGLLRTLGTTDIQLKKIVARQCAGIWIPGCVLGGGIGSVFMIFFLPRILAGLYLQGLGSAEEMVTFYPEFLVVSVLFAGVTVRLASGMAMRRVMKLSPVESLRYEEVRETEKYDKEKRNCRASLGYMAFQNVTRNRRRFWLTLFSLSLGGITALGAVVLGRGTDTTNQIEQQPDFDIALLYNIMNISGSVAKLTESDAVIPDDFAEKVLGIDGIAEENVTFTRGCYGILNIDKEQGDKVLEPLRMSVQGEDEENFFATIQVVDDSYIDELETYVKKNGLKADMDSFRNGTGTLILHEHQLSLKLQEMADENIGEMVSFYGLEAFGEKLEDAKEKYLKGELSCSGYLDASKKYFPKLRRTWHGKGINYFLMSEKAFQKLGYKNSIFGMQIQVERGQEPLIKQKLTQLIQNQNNLESSQGDYYMNCKSDSLEAAASYIQASRMIMGALSVLLLFMGTANYFNTMYTGITARRKELAVMESVGMTRGQLRRMLLFEGGFYGVCVTAVLLLPGSAILWGLGKLIRKNLLYFRFYYPWEWMLGISVLILAVCVLTVQFHYGRLCRQSVAERLRRYAD